MALVLWCGLCLAVGLTGSIPTSSSLADWYVTLIKPSWTPPGWLFGPVWTVLYIMMGVAAWMVWRPRGFSSAKVPLKLFFFQLALNAAWSWLFFGMRNPFVGLVDIAFLWIAIAATIISFRKVNVGASWLMVPYLLWVSYAAALNFAIFWMNRPA